MSEVEWMLLLVQLPSSPSSARVAVWRRMKAAGAIGLNNGIWALPVSTKHRSIMEEIESYVNSHDGNAGLFITKALRDQDNVRLIEEFNSNIKKDYVEFIDKCNKFIREIKKDTGQKKFTLEELDESEARLRTLASWHRKIQARDVFKSGKAQDAGKAMDECRKLLRAFMRSVYEKEGIEVPEGDVEENDIENRDA